MYNSLLETFITAADLSLIHISHEYFQSSEQFPVSAAFRGRSYNQNISSDNLLPLRIISFILSLNDGDFNEYDGDKTAVQHI